jgi:charged multivesicular body protein 3
MFRKKKPSMEEQVKSWNQSLRSEERNLQRQIRSMERTEKKLLKDIQAASKTDKQTAKIYAKQVVVARKEVSRLYTAKARVSSASMQLKESLSTQKLAHSMKISGSVLAKVQSLVNFPALSRVMGEVSREMEKSGIVEEMIGDTLDDALDYDSDMDDEVDAEVDKVLDEILAGGPVRDKSKAAEGKETEESEDDDEEEAISRRLDKLRT